MKEADAMKAQAVAAPAPEATDVAEGTSADREAAPPAPLAIDLEAAVDLVLRAFEEATLEELEAAAAPVPGKLDGEDG
jgi:hypothetical protein